MSRFCRLLHTISAGKIVLIISLAASDANAADVDLWQAVQLGQRHDESVQIAQKGIEERRLQKRISYAPLLPQVSARASATSEENARRTFPGTGGSTTGNTRSLDVVQTVWNAQQHTNYDNSKKNLQLAYLENSRAVAANIFNVTDAYFGVLSSISSLTLARSNVEGVEAHKEIVDTLFSIHESTILEQTETEADLDLARVAVIRADNDLANSVQQFVLFVGEGEHNLAPVIPNLETIRQSSGRPLDEWLEIAEQRNYDLQISRVRLEIAENNIRQARREYYPSVTFRASMIQDDPLGDAFGEEFTRQAVLTMDIPVYQGGRKAAQVREAQVAYDLQRLRISQQIKQVHQQVTDFYRNRQSLQKRIFALRSLADSNRKKLDATKDGFARGDRTSNEVLDAQNLLIQSEIDLISAIHDYILSGLQLKQSAGILSLEDIKAVNQLYFTAT